MVINMLPDDILLDIFDAYRRYWSNFRDLIVWPWDRLVHVCRRWRQIVFASPLRLHLYLHCAFFRASGPDVRKFLGCWPAFPISVDYTRRKGFTPDDEDNVLAALEHSDRVGILCLHLKAPQLERLATVMQKPFPLLKKLDILGTSWPVPVLPGGFLGGSASCLQELKVDDVLFPELPTLLLSTRDLVTLHLSRAGYISPEVMAASLAPLTELRSFSIRLQSPTSLDQQPAPVTHTRTVLPSLTSIVFSCDCRYVEDLVARIDCPRLKGIDLYLDYSSVGLQLSQVFEFINRSEDPRLTQFSRVLVCIDTSYLASLDMTFNFEEKHHIPIFISLLDPSWTNSHIFQVFSQFSTLFSNVLYFSISINSSRVMPFTKLDWVQLLVPFSNLQTLHVSGDRVGDIVLALEGGEGEMTTEILPALELLYIEGEPVSSLSRFCAVCWLSGRPVTFVNTQKEFYERLESYAY